MKNALMTDMYELTMLESFIESGRVNDEAVFEVFTRKLPAGRRFGVFAGLGRLVPMLRDFTFMGDELRWIRENEIVNKETYNYLSDYQFKGQINAYVEGDIFFPNSPVFTVSGTLGECVVLETLILSVLNHDSAIATTAARMRMSAKGRPLIEMGSRRTDEESAVHAARAAYIAGFDSTSNLLAGKTYGIPTVGTAAHAFTLAHEDELTAFEAQVRAFGANTTLLVDTYDIEQGIRNAVKAAGKSLGAIRIDSGDLATEAAKARKLLDDLGAYGTRIIVTSDLDEYVLKDLQEAPIDSYGVGTKLVASAPMGFVYKLVEINGRAVAKKSKDKASIGGSKTAWKVYDDTGKMVDEVFTVEGDPRPRGHVISANPTLDIRTFVSGREKFTRNDHSEFIGELPIGEQKVWNGDFGPYITCHRLDTVEPGVVV
jgi:putative nicotinate phosphoribosyltransferase